MTIITEIEENKEKYAAKIHKGKERGTRNLEDS